MKIKHLALSALLLISTANATIPFTYVKEIYSQNNLPILKDDYKHLSPLWGFLALKSGLIYNLRFYGNMQWGYKQDGVTREYAKDTGNDGITKVIRILFPSTGGDLTTTSMAISDIASKLTVQNVAEILNFIQEYRANPTINLTLTELKTKDFKVLKDCIIEVISTEKTKQYPPYFLEKVILAFFWEKFNAKEEIQDLYNNLNQNFKNIDKSVLTNDQFTINNYQALTTAETPEELIQIFYGYPYFSSLTPYNNGEKLLSNASARCWNQEEQKQLDNLTIADCVEISIRHLFNFLLFDKDKDGFDVNSLEENIKKILGEKWQPNVAFKNLIDFYTISQSKKSDANNGTFETRSAWSKVVQDLNSVPGLPANLSDDLHRVYYHKDGSGNPKRCEDFTGFLNLVNIIEHIIGVPLEVFGDPDQQDAIKESENYIRVNEDNFDNKYSKQLREYVGNKFNIFLGLFKSSYQYKLKNITVGTMNGLPDGNPYDRFDGKIEIEGSNQALGSFIFTVNTIAGHEWTDLVSETSKVELIDHRENLKNNLIFTHEELLNSLKQKDKNYSNDFYNLYASGLLTSNDARIAFVNAVGKLAKIPKYLEVVLTKVLGEINWNDAYTVKKCYQALQNILQREELDEKVFNDIQILDCGYIHEIGNLSNLSNLSKLRNLRKLTLSKSIESIGNLENFTSLELLDLNGSNIQSIGNIKNLPKLEELDLQDTKNLKSVGDLEDLTNLKKLNINNSSIEKIGNLKNLPKLERLFGTKTLKSIGDLEGLTSLEYFGILHSSIEKIGNLRNLPKLKEVDLRKIKTIKSIGNLEDLTSLEKIRMESSTIQSIGKLSNLPKLEYIYLNDTKNLESIGDLEGFSELKALFLSSSGIQSIGKLNNLPKLEYILLEDTKNLESIGDLEWISKIKSIEIKGSKLTKDKFHTYYKNKVYNR